MNKIFMTKRRHDGEIAVCSELTRSKGKMKSFVAAVATAAALATPVAEAASVATVDAQNQVVSNGEGVKIETKGSTVAIGGATVGTGSSKEVAIGSGTSANGQNAVAVGSGNNASTTQTTVFGSNSQATMQQATAIGNEVLAAGYSSITIGGDDAGAKNPEDNLKKGANTQYATFVYDAALDEVISNPYSVGSSSTTKISIDPKDASDPSKASQTFTRKTVVVATRTPTMNNNNNQVPLLSDAQKAMLKDLGIRTTPKNFTNVLYAREKNKANTVVIDGNMTYEQMLNAALEGKDPANYLGRLLEKYKAEAQIAAGDTPLSDEQATEQAYVSIENLAAEMGVATTAADGTSLSREAKIANLLTKYYDPYQGTRTTGGSSIAIGIKAQSLADGAVSLGTAAISRGKESLALGVGTITSGERAIGMGTLSVASGDRSIAIGTYTEAPDTVNGEMRYDAPRALAEDAVAIGSGAYVGLDVSGTKSVALGAGSIVTTGYGDIRENYAKGTWEGILRNYSDYDPNKAPGINEEYKTRTVIAAGTLLPKGAKYITTTGNEVTLTADTIINEQVTLLNDVVETHKQFTLGKTTTGGTTGTIDKAYVGRLVYRDFAGATAVGAVSVGYSGAEKRIQNVAAGEVSPTSTDAINGSQLYIASQEITSEIENTFFHINDGSGEQEVGDTNANKGKIAESAGARGAYTVTAGINTRATGESSSSLGHNAIAGMLDGRYKQVKEIDRVLAEKRAENAKVTDTIAASEKTIEYATERLAKIAQELATYEANKAALEDKLKTSNGDEKARISAQITKLGIARTELLKQQKDVTAERAAAENKLTKATATRATLEADIAAKSDELKAFMNANAKSSALASGVDSEAGGEASVALGKNAAAHGTSSIALGQDTISGLTKEDQKTIDDAVAKFDAKEKEYDTAVKTLADLENAKQTAEEEKAQAQKDLEKATEANDESAKTQAQARIAAADARIAELDRKIPEVEAKVHTSKTDLDAERDNVTTVINAITAEGANKIKNYTIAIGHEAIASGEAAISIGKGNIVSGDNSGAFGDPSIVAGAGSYTQGNDNAVGSKAKNVGAFGNNNQIGATATYNADGKLQTADGLANESAVENSRVVGNNNYINTSNTYVLGSGVGVKDDKSVLGTVANSVYLGNDSTAVETAGNNVDKDGTAGTTTTAGATGTVQNATLLGVTYGDFAAQTAKGAIAVGSAGEERRIMNVAAGEISKTSTDAINGSQLYYVAKQAAKPFSVTANTNNDTDAETMDDVVYAAKDGKQVQLGETLNIAGSKTSKSLTRDDSGAATDGTYSAKNIQTIVDDSGVQIQMAEKPEFKELTVKADDNDSNPVTITSGAGDTGGTISNLATKLPSPTNNAASKPADVVTTNAATLGDVLNAGWNVQTNATALDFVQAYDTVNFANGNATAVSGEMKDGVATIKVDVQVDGSTITVNQDGKLTASQPETTDLTVSTAPTDTNSQPPAGKVEAPSTADADKLVKAGDIAEAINNAGFTLKTSATADGKKDASTDAELINAGDAVEMVAGKNLTVKQEADGKITYATKDDVTFNTTTIGGTKKDDGSVENPITIGTADGKNVISNLSTTLPDNSAQTAGTKPTSPTTTNAATLGDVLNAGWNLKENSAEKDFVTAYDTVDFVNGEGTTVNITSTNGVSKVKVDVNKGTIKTPTNGSLSNDAADDNKFTTVKNVVEAVNATYWNIHANGTAVNDGKVNPANTVNIRGKGAVNVTAGADSTTDAYNIDIELNTTTLADANTTSADGNTVTNTPDGKIDTPAEADKNKFVTAGDIANAINAAGWKAETTGNNLTAANTEGTTLVKAGDTVQFEAGSNLKVGRAGNKFTYELNPVLTNLTSAEFKDGTNVTKITPTGTTTTDGTTTTTVAPTEIKVGDKQGDTDTPITISSTTTDGNTKNVIDGLTNNLPETKNATDDTTTKTQDAPTDTAINNNAATVGDVLNAGWNLKAQDQAVDFVKPYDTVNIKGDGAIKVAGTNTDGATSTVTISVETTTLKDEKKAGDNNTLVDGKDGKVDAPAEGDKNKLVTAENIANAINNSGFTLKSSAVANQGEKLTGTQTGDEVINPGDVIEMVAGKNMTVKQDQNGKITYATKDNVEFNTVKVGTTGTGTDTKKPVELKTENAKPATNNPDNNKPTTALDIKSTDSKPTQITGVGSTLNTTNVDTKPNGTAGTDTLVDLKGTDNAPVNKNAAATVGDLQNMGWVVKAAGNAYSDVVKNANEVNFVGTNLAKVTGETDTNGVRTITVDVNAQNVTNKSQLPVEYTKADGTKVYPKVAEDGTVTYTTNPDGTGDVVPNDQVITSVNGPDGTTNPTTLTNVKSTLPGSVGNTLTGDNDATKVAAPDFTTPNAADAKKLNNAATVSDVLSAGWNLQGNGVAKDFVKPYDTVNFINGDGTTVEVKTDQDGKLSTIKVNTAMRYTDSAGNPLVKNDADGKFYPPTTDGKPDTTKTGVNAGDVQLSTINPDGTSTTATKLGNVAQGAGTLDGTVDANGQPLVKVGNQYYTPDQFVNGKLKNDAQPTTPAGTTNAAYNGLADLNSANPTNVMTVADAKNLGWVVSASGNGYADDVRNANQVDFVGTGLAKVTGETKNGIRTITVNVDAQKTVEAADTPVIYTDADGNKLVKGEDGKFYKPADIENLVFNPTDKKYYPAGTTFNDQGVANNNVQPSTLTPASNVIASMNDGDNKADSPKQLANVGGNLAPTYNKGDATETNGKLGDTTADAPTKSQTAPTAENVKKMYNNAATVGDVLNAGWNLQGNGVAKDFVKPYDTVNFADGTGTKVDVSTDADGKVSTVKVNVDTVGLTNNPNGKVVTPAESLQKALDAANQELRDLQATGTATPEALKAAQDKVADAQKALDNAGNKIATAADVADAINKSGWNVTSAVATGSTGSVTGTTDELINPGEQVTFKAGNNMVLKQEGNNFTYSVSENPEFNSVTVGEPAYQKADGTPVNKVGDKYYTADGQEVAAGDVVKATKPAVNMTAEEAKPATNNGNNQPSTALNITSADGNPTQITGVGSTLNTTTVNTNPDGKADTPVTENKLVNLTENGVNPNSAATVGDLQNMGWVVSATGNGYTDTVKNANKVDFVGKGLATVTGETKDGVRTITVNVDAQRTVEAADTPVIYTDKDGNKLTKVGDNFYQADEVTVIDGKVYPKGSVVIDGKVYPEGSSKGQDGNITKDGQPVTEQTEYATTVPNTNVIASMNDGDNTADSPKQLANVGGNLAPTYNKDDATETNGKLGNTTAAAPTKSQSAPEADKVKNMYNNAATVGDVLNAGWNLQGNGVAKDFVKPYDTVNFVDGTGTTVDVSTDADGKVSTIKVNTVMQYTDANGNPVKKVGNSYYPADSVVDAAGNVYPAGTQLDQDGNVVGDATEVEPVENVQVNVVNPTDNTSTTATKLGNVDAGAGTLDGSNRGDKPTADTPTVIDDSTPLGTEIKNAYKGLADLANAVATNVMTVADAKNLGWVVSASGDNYADDVRNANQVDFVGTGLATVTGKTDDKGVRTITVNVDAQRTVEAADTPVIYTDKDGNKLTKVGDNFYKADDVTVIDGKAYPKGAVKDPQTGEIKKDGVEVAEKTENDAVKPADVIASMNDGDNTADSPKQLANVGGNLVPTYNKDDAKETDGKLGNTTADTPTKSQTAPTADDVKKMYNNAATVGDVLNAGWNLQGNGVAKDFVKPYDTVNFADGTGTTVDVSTDADGKVSTVKVNVDTVGLTNNANGGVENPTKAAQEALDAAQKALDEANAGTDEAAKEAAAKDVQAAQKALDKANNQIATAQDVANAINNSGWNVIAEANGGVVSGSNKELVKPSETVSLKAGKNIEIAQDGQNFTFRTSANPEFNSVTVGDPAYQKADGTPVNKVGDKYYTADGQEVAAGDVVKATKPAVNMTAEAAKPATNNGNNQPSTALNITSADGKPTQITGVGSSLNTKAVPTSPTGSGGTTENIDLVDLVGTNTAPINKNAAATVGDLANMGWIVSATGNGYKDAVKNANQVDFVGTGLATVKGETKDGIRTITVDVNAQNTVESAQNPVVYTDANGNKVTKADDGNFYPADSVVIDSKRYPKGSVKQADGSIVDANGQAVAEVQPIAKGDIIASMNNGDNATKPTTLSNVGSNLTPTTSGDTLINKDGTTTAGQTPTKEAKAPTNAAKINNNAATVGDVLNAGWNLQGNGSAVDFVKPYDTVNFVDGVGTLVKATSDGATSVIQVDVDKGSINVNTTTGAVTPTNLTALDRAIADATKALDDAKAANPTDPNAQAIKDAEVALAKAEADKAKVLNKVATVEDVASALKNSGFTLKSSAVDTGTKLSGDDELINPGETVEMVAGKNLTVKQEANGKVTYATKDEVNFKSVEVGNAEPTYRDADGNELVKVGDNFYKKDEYTAAPDKADGTGKDLTGLDTARVDREKSDTVPVKLTSDKGVATKDTTLDADGDGKPEITTNDAPSALSVKDSLGENSQINGIASALDTKEVATKPLVVDADGNPVADKQTGKDKLVDLTAPTDPDTKAKWESSAVTVGDIANMGWIVSASGNEYTNTVKNANKVDFKGENGISVTGKTTADGVREITVSLEKGEVIGANEGTVKIDGKDTDVVKVGDEYFKKEDIDPTTGKPKEGTTALGNDVVGNNGKNVVNNGDKFVDGHSVAKAIQESGFTVGKETDTSGVDFNNSDEKVNPNDELRFADGKGTTVSTGTVKTIDPNGEVSTKTVVKVDVDTVGLTNNANGTVVTPAETLQKAVDAAQDALDALDPKTATAEEQKAAQDALTAAQNELANAGNKIATATDVANAINNSGWMTTAVNATTGATENVVVNPGEAVNYVNGNGTVANVTVSTGTNGKDNVSVSYDVDKGAITPNADGSVVGISAEEAQTLQNNLADAQKALAAVEALGDNAPESVKNAAKAAVYDAEKAIAKVQNKVATVENVVNAINKSGFTLTAQGENGSLVSPGETVDMKNTDGNIKISKSKDNNDVVYNMAPDVKIEKSVTAPTVNANTVNVQGAAGTTALTTVAGGNYNSAGQKIDNTAVPALSVGGNQITNVANGAINATSKDAVNGSQLYTLKNDMNQKLGDVHNRIGKVTRGLRAGVAGAAAIAGLPEIHLAGKSMVAAAASTYKGENAIAVGYSRLSDNSKIKLKLSGSANSRGDLIGTVGVGYAW